MPMGADVNSHIRKTSSVFAQPTSNNNLNLSIKDKIVFYRAFVYITLSPANKAWTFSKANKNSSVLFIFATLFVTYLFVAVNKELLKCIGQTKTYNMLRLHWLDSIHWMKNIQISNYSLYEMFSKYNWIFISLSKRYMQELSEIT